MTDLHRAGLRSWGSRATTVLGLSWGYHICLLAMDLMLLHVNRNNKWTHTHTHTQPFYGSVEFVWDNPGEPVPEETFTHSHSSWSSIISIYFLHLLRSMASSVFNPHALQSFSTISLQVFLVYLLAWYPPLHTPYISSPNHCLLFAAHAHTIATCSARCSTRS